MLLNQLHDADNTEKIAQKLESQLKILDSFVAFIAIKNGAMER